MNDDSRCRPSFPFAAVAAAAALLLGGCAAPPAHPPVAPPPAPVAEVPPPALPEPPPAIPPPPASPAAQQQAAKVALAAAELLQAGNEEQARAELQRALGIDPYGKLALNLQRQIGADPQAVLGRESFAYTVKPGETLSRIAGRFLNDIYAFYILAKYNDIKVPKLVAGGQVLRIPGKMPPPERTVDKALSKPPAATAAAAPSPAAPPAPVVAALTPPAPPPAPEPTPGEKAMGAAQAAERGGDFERALAEYRRAAGLDQPDASAKVAQMQRQLVTRHTTDARRASARQDLKTAIAQWDRVIELDPDNASARLERQKAVELKKKLDAL